MPNLLSILQIEQPEFLASKFSASSIKNPKVLGLDLPNRIQGKYIVVFDEALPNNDSFAKSTSIANEWKENYQIEVEHVFQHVLNGMSIQATDEQVERLAKDERVQYIEAEQSNKLHEDYHPLISADPQGWALDAIDQRTHATLNNQYHYKNNASQVHVYVMDTGIKASISRFGGRVSGGVSFISDGRGTDDCNGHGTGVASVIGGNPPSAGAETVGTTLPLLHPIRILPCSGTSISDSTTIQGLDWVFANHVKPAIVNMSFGGPHTNGKKTALTNLINAGVIAVGGPGNDGIDGYGNSFCSNTFPVDVPTIISVSSVNINIDRYPQASVGDCVSLFAPGHNVDAANLTGGTYPQTGTSYAIPFVSGTAAMFLAENPQATPAQTKKRIVDTATRFVVGGVPTLHHSNRFLYSLLDAPEGLINYGTYMPLSISVINEQCRGANTVEWTRPLSGGTSFNYEVATSPYKDFNANVTIHGNYTSSSSKVSIPVSVTIGQQKYIRVRARQQVMPYATWSHPIYSETPATYFNGCL
ncbi:S8 family serine peptidase [Leptospira sp. 201903070]|uniref:S8 family serine peptidase n=1 Tax=Leptospira ainlahdjerensis TaxID=2810033 RepID=A0ABS2U5U0_9LEPT|nr:S8 family serine peptidase [Leptospira ainlahdjerensis]